MAQRTDTAVVEAELARQQVRAEVVRFRRQVDEDRADLRATWSATVGPESELAEHEGIAMAAAGVVGFVLGRTTGFPSGGASKRDRTSAAEDPGILTRGLGAASSLTLAAAGSELRDAAREAVAAFVDGATSRTTSAELTPPGATEFVGRGDLKL